LEGKFSDFVKNVEGGIFQILCLYGTKFEMEKHKFGKTGYQAGGQQKIGQIA
jgi:hypothetical protein